MTKSDLFVQDRQYDCAASTEADRSSLIYVPYFMQKGGMYDLSLRAIVLPVWAKANKL